MVGGAVQWGGRSHHKALIILGNNAPLRDQKQSTGTASSSSLPRCRKSPKAEGRQSPRNLVRKRVSLCYPTFPACQTLALLEVAGGTGGGSCLNHHQAGDGRCGLSLFPLLLPSPTVLLSTNIICIACLSLHLPACHRIWTGCSSHLHWVYNCEALSLIRQETYPSAADTSTPPPPAPPPQPRLKMNAIREKLRRKLSMNDKERESACHSPSPHGDQKPASSEPYPD